MSKLIDAVDNLCLEVHKNVSYLNSGGCAVFASFMAQCLANYGNVAIAVGSNSGESTSIDKVRTLIESNTIYEWNDNGVVFAHVVVEFEHDGLKYHIDSTGVHPARYSTHMGNFDILDGRLSVQEITELASATKGWNSTFNRQQIPNIKKMIDDGFETMCKQGLVPILAS